MQELQAHKVQLVPQETQDPLVLMDDPETWVHVVPPAHQAQQVHLERKAHLVIPEESQVQGPVHQVPPDHQADQEDQVPQDDPVNQVAMEIQATQARLVMQEPQVIPDDPVAPDHLAILVAQAQLAAATIVHQRVWLQATKRFQSCQFYL